MAAPALANGTGRVGTILNRVQGGSFSAMRLPMGTTPILIRSGLGGAPLQSAVAPGHFTVIRVNDVGATLNNGTFVPMSPGTMKRLRIAAGAHIELAKAGTRTFRITNDDARRMDFGRARVESISGNKVRVRTANGDVLMLTMSPKDVHKLGLRSGRFVKLGPSNDPDRFLVRVE